jgi:hypothetical protein
MIKIICFLTSILTLTISYSQNNEIEIIKDNRIDVLVKKQGEIIPPATVPQITGYRIQLFFDTEKKAVDDARAKFISMYPKVDTYVIYTAPNYFLKVGNFRTHLEAEKVKISVDRDFPTNYIVKELINLPRID